MQGRIAKKKNKGLIRLIAKYFVDYWPRER